MSSLNPHQAAWLRRIASAGGTLQLTGHGRVQMQARTREHLASCGYLTWQCLLGQHGDVRTICYYILERGLEVLLAYEQRCRVKARRKMARLQTAERLALAHVENNSLQA